MKNAFSILLFFTLALTPLLAETSSNLPAPGIANAAYGEHERQVLDLWQAKKAKKPAPLLIYIHGGGWAARDKSDLPVKLLDQMLSHGISVATVNYRFSTTHPLPVPVHDAARAVQFLRLKADEWNLDPKRFAAYGVSAGATTTLWLACHDDLAEPASADPVARQSTRLRAAVALSPQTTLDSMQASEWVGLQVLAHPMMARAVGAPNNEAMHQPKPEWLRLLREFSAINHVNAGDPPILIQNPRVDPLPAENASSAIHHATFGVKFKEKADAAGVPCILRLQDAPEATPAPEAFLVERLTR